MRLLVLTHSFPPSLHSNAKRPFYLVKGFLAQGWQVDVYTSRLAMDLNAGESLTHPGLRIFRCTDPVARLGRKLSRPEVLGKAFGLAAAGLLWPDGFALWARQALAAIAKAGHYDRALGFVLPASVLLSGRVPGLVGPHWTFDYQESVTPLYRRRLHVRRSPLQRLRLPRLSRLESTTLHQAGRVSFTAETNRQAYVSDGLVEDSNTVHVPYFFDAEVFSRPAPEIEPGFSISYFGTFYRRGARSPETFLKSLAEFLKHRPDARPRTKFRFYGHWLPEHDRWLNELKLHDVVFLHPPVGYEAYLQKVRESPILLLVVASAHNLFMPSKIVDYFGARRPILAFVPRGSEMRQVLERAGVAGFACDEFDVNAGVSALQKLWAAYRSGPLQVDQEKTSYWSSDVQVPRYVEVVTRSH